MKKLRVITTGGDEYQAEREQWDDGNNVVALEPGVVVAYYEATNTPTQASQGRASRCSRSTARSWDAVAAAVTA